MFARQIDDFSSGLQILTLASILLVVRKHKFCQYLHSVVSSATLIRSFSYHFSSALILTLLSVCDISGAHIIEGT